MSNDELNKTMEELFKDHLNSNQKNQENEKMLKKPLEPVVSKPLRDWRKSHPNPLRDGKQFCIF